MYCLALIIIIIIVFCVFYQQNTAEGFINMDNINMYSNGKQIVRRTHRNLKSGIKDSFNNIKGSINRALRTRLLK
jgi:hypothetical protein